LECLRFIFTVIEEFELWREVEMERERRERWREWRESEREKARER